MEHLLKLAIIIMLLHNGLLQSMHFNDLLFDTGVSD